MAAIGQDPVMSFVGWENRVASYEFTLKEWKQDKLVLVRTFH